MTPYLSTLSHRVLACVLLGGLFAVACQDEGVGPLEGYQQMESLDDSDWNAFRNDPQRTGHAPHADVPDTPREVWRVEDINTDSYSAAKSSPVVAGDMVFVGSDQSLLYGVDRTTGEVAWTSEIEGASKGIHGSPAIGPDGLVYVGAYNGRVYGYDRQSGERRWNYKLGFQIGSSPVYVPSHGRVYTSHEKSSNGGGFVSGLHAKSGREIWVRPFRAHAHSSVAIDLSRDRLFVGDNLAILHAYDLESGERIWRHQLDQPGDKESDIKSTPTVLEDRGLVVFGAWSGKLHALDADWGRQQWELDVGAWIMGSAAYAPERGVVYVGSLSPTAALHAVDADSGEELWRFEPGAGIMSSPAVDGDESTVVFGSNDGFLYAVDAETGQQQWRHRIGGPVTGSPALVDDWVYVTAKRGDLVAVRGETE